MSAVKAVAKFAHHAASRLSSTRPRHALCRSRSCASSIPSPQRARGRHSHRRPPPRTRRPELVEAGCRNAVVTLGAKGALLVNASGVSGSPRPKSSRSIPWVQDCFTGWLATGIAEASACLTLSPRHPRRRHRHHPPRRSECYAQTRRGLPIDTASALKLLNGFLLNTCRLSRRISRCVDSLNFVRKTTSR